VRFTIITPTLNREKYVAEAIESVLAQEYDDVEHWIIDGGSTDRTLEVVQSYPHLRMISEPDRGVYDAFNKGLDRATGDAVIFLNSDDILAPGALALAKEIFENTLGTKIVSGGCEIFRRTDSGREIVMHRYENAREYQLSFRNVTLGLPNINARIFRRGVFDQLGRFDLAYPIASDRELLLRAARANLPDAPVSKVLYRYRWHDQSLTMNAGSTTMSRAQLDGLSLINRLLPDPGISEEQRRLLRQWRRVCFANDIMVQVISGKASRAFTIFFSAIKRDPALPLGLLRLGLLAIGRRVPKYYRLFRATHAA
jgi:glycosyltransferase involved in cell wall biosynthesis